MTTLQIINIAKISQFLAATDVAKGVLFGPRVTPDTPKVLFMERKAVEWLYLLDPTNSTLTLTANYLYSLCRGYNLRALYILNNGGSGGGISPIVPTQQYPIYITEADFTTATLYPNTRIFGTPIIIFLNEINRYLIPGSEFTVAQAGVTITLDGFDATQFTYNLVIEKIST